MSRRRDSPGRVLVANRGEIAVRIIRACRELGRSPVAGYGDGEERALHVRLADDAYRLPAGAGLPYLDIDALVAIARRANVDAIHPGYGFLAENAAFAEACGEAGFVFVGPSVAAIRMMGDKVEARRIARSAGLPVVPGSDGPVATIEEATAWAAEHGYPLAVKAAGGGGGRGFRVARREPELADAFAGSVGEARRYFANPVVYLERYLERPRHIEIQLFADQLSNTVALGERDCSIQRRHQKLIEETPSPAVGADLRASLEGAALALARAVGYVGAGTVEFLVDETGEFYFLEMNTRIQVEHTVTEAVTGLDLVAEQLRVASGLPLSFQQEDVQARGHAIECRINAEDPGRDFAPTPGTLGGYLAPAGPGVRVDSAMEPEARIDPAYDSLIAKVIVWDRDRPRAIARMRRALGEFQISGLPTTIPFHLAVLNHP
ncbi:MAG: acetyl-CoA carboxylase biotin carboxylase subunit, partial [Chloroflexia bacterium]|nr:acetyl-CoA carboxylase biotin carboxylase subunit [Chloroflexia bacterium]